MSLCIFLNTNNADNTNIIFAHGSHSHGCLFAAVRSQFFEHEIRRRHTDRREVIKRMSRTFFCTRIARISRIFVRGGALTGGLNTRFFWTRDSPKAHWPQGGNNANDTNNYLHADLALYLKRTPIARMHVRVGTLTWGLLNENDTNEIKMDPIRGFVNTHCLCLVMEIESLYSFSPTIGKNYFHCTHLSKKFQIFTAVHNSMFKNQQQRYVLLN